MTNPESAAQPSTEASEETLFQFLQTQVSYVVSHLQIADTKAGGVIAYITVLTGYTASKNSYTSPPGLANWLALIGGVAAAFALVTAFVSIVPRSWKGRDSNDPFSWVGLSSSESGIPYGDRLPQLSPRDLVRALADTVETSAFIIRRKYRLVAAAVVATIVSTALQAASWLTA